MGQTTAIAWTDHTLNFWHGCVKVSPGCEQCYAETLSRRYGRDIWGPAKNYAANEKIHWVIVGGESGAKCRPFEVDWARSILAQCRAYDVAFFMKQLGGYPNKRHEMSEFPEDLRVQEFPA